MPHFNRAATFVVLTGTTLLTVSTANGSHRYAGDDLRPRSSSADVSGAPAKSRGVQLRELGLSLVRELTHIAAPKSAFPLPFVPDVTASEPALPTAAAARCAFDTQSSTLLIRLLAHSIQTRAP